MFFSTAGDTLSGVLVLPSLKGYVTQLEKVERRRVRIIKGWRMPVQVGRGLQICAWHRTGKRLFAISSSVRTKHHEMQLAVARFKATVRSQFFVKWVVDLWNTLPEDAALCGCASGDLCTDKCAPSYLYEQLRWLSRLLQILPFGFCCIRSIILQTSNPIYDWLSIPILFSITME